MKFRSLLGIALALSTSVFLSSCGGGGAATTGGVEGGTVAILPAAGIIYAGVPTTIQVTGGRTPYTLTTSDTTLLPVPNPLNGHSFDVVPPNPSVIDTGLPPGALPVRTVNLTARDATGNTATAAIQIARNFLTGYGFEFTSQACLNPPSTTGTTSTAVVPTAGCDTVVEVFATINGNIQANQTFKFDAVLGNFQLVDPNTGNASSSVTTTTDHNGVASVIIRVPSSANTQIGVFRITDVATGVSTTNAFTIEGNANTSTLTVLPASFTFTGQTTTDCGVGSGQFFVFGGLPPYRALSSDTNVTVGVVDANSSPGVFSVTASNSAVCVAGATIVVTDSGGAHATVTVDTKPGSVTPPAPTPVSVSPSSITLDCGQSGSASAVGGTGTYSASASNTNLHATVSGHTVTITRQLHDSGASYPSAETVTVTDGSSAATVNVTNLTASCP